MPAAPILILTRPIAQSQRFLSQCQAAIPTTFDAILSPVLRIEYLGAPGLSGFCGVIFTSENGVNAVLDHARAIPAYCVGARTAQAATQAGFVAHAASGSARDLADLIHQAQPKGPLIHLRGKHQTGDLAGELGKAGLNVQSCVVYDQIAEKLSDTALVALRGSGRVILPVFSARSAGLILDQAGTLAESVDVIAISSTVADAFSNNALHVSVAKTPDATGILTEIARLMVA